MTDKLRARIEKDAVEYANPSGNAEAAKSMAVTNRVVSYLLGAHSLLPVVEKLKAALEYVKEHELYHGVNQGKPHEQTVDEALSYLEQWEKGDGG